jgi:2-phosphosulfolactate phosphatase
MSRGQDVRVERRSALAGAQGAEGIVVVIDVLRAFTCASIMFGYGASELVLVGATEQAWELRRRDSSYLLAGEVDGIEVDGFDVPNSPKEIMEKGEIFFKRRKVVLRSSSGTQGAVAAAPTAREIVIAGYTTASAVARYISKKIESKRKEDGDLVVTLVAMGLAAREKSVEDERCADYIEHLLNKRPYDHLAAIGECLTDPLIAKALGGERQHLPKEDVVLSLQRDVFDFAMVGKRVGDAVVVTPVPQ